MSDSSAAASKEVLIKVSMPREHGSGFMTLKVDSDATRIGELKRQLLEKVRTKRVSISVPQDGVMPSTAPVPPLPQAAIDEYGLTLFEEPTTTAATTPATKSAVPVFLADDRLLRDLRKQFLNVPIWKLSLVPKPKKETGVTEGWLKKKSSSSRLFGAWQKRFFRLTTKQLAYWNTAEEAALGREDPVKNPPKSVFPVSAFHEAIAVAPKDSAPSTVNSATSPTPTTASSPRGRVARQASVANTNLDSTRVRLGPWGSWIFILEFPGRSLELQAASKDEFQRWVDGFFGKEYLSNLVVAHADDDKQNATPLVLPTSYPSNTQGISTKITGTTIASGLPVTGQHTDAIPIDQSRLGGPSVLREHSLSARDVLRGDNGLFNNVYSSGGTVNGSSNRDDVDSEDSMSQAWHDRMMSDDNQTNWQLASLTNGNTNTSFGASIPIEREDSHSENGGAGGRVLDSFMPSASVTPVSSIIRPDEDENPLDRQPIIFQSEPDRSQEPEKPQPQIADADHTVNITGADDSSDESDVEDTKEDAAPPPPIAPFPVTAPPVSVAATTPTTPAALSPISPIPIEPTPPPTPSPPIPPPVPAVPATITPSPTSSLFAGGFGSASGAASGGHRGSLMGTATIAAAALDVHPGASPSASTHARKDSFSVGLSPMASHGRRPSMDQAAPIMPPSGTELNFTPTLQRRLSHSGIAPFIPPLPPGPPPAVEVEPIPPVPVEPPPPPIPSPEEIARLEAERQAKLAQERNLDNIRRYLEAEAAAEAAKTAPTIEPEVEIPPPVAPFPTTSVSPVSPVSSIPIEAEEPEEDSDAKELTTFRLSLEAQPHSQLVDLATNQQRELLELRRRLEALQLKQQHQSSQQFILIAQLQDELQAEREMREAVEKELQLNFVNVNVPREHGRAQVQEQFQLAKFDPPATATGTGTGTTSAPPEPISETRSPRPAAAAVSTHESPTPTMSSTGTTHKQFHGRSKSPSAQQLAKCTPWLPADERPIQRPAASIRLSPDGRPVWQNPSRKTREIPLIDSLASSSSDLEANEQASIVRGRSRSPTRPRTIVNLR